VIGAVVPIGAVVTGAATGVVPAIGVVTTGIVGAAGSVGNAIGDVGRGDVGRIVTGLGTFATGTDNVTAGVAAVDTTAVTGPVVVIVSAAGVEFTATLIVVLTGAFTAANVALTAVETCGVRVIAGTSDREASVTFVTTGGATATTSIVATRVALITSEGKAIEERDSPSSAG
jgi:hypothetical protein